MTLQRNAVKALKKRYHKFQAKRFRRAGDKLLTKAFVYGNVDAKRLYNDKVNIAAHHHYLSLG